MPRFFVKTNQVKDNKIYIQGEDIKHIKNVLRKEIGNELVGHANSVDDHFHTEKNKLR